MAIRKYKPNTAGRRISSVGVFSDLTKKRPEKKLILIKKKKGSRNVRGKITVYHQGGGAKRYLRKIDFKQDRFDQVAEVLTIEYDPNRNARIALVRFEDGEKRYILAPVGLAVGDKVVSSRNKIEIKNGNRLILKNVPPGILIHNLELVPGRGGEIIRSAGNSAIVQTIENGLVQIKLPSGEIRLVPENCMASIGQVSNPDYRHIRWGKAGRIRHKGIRPTVRGKVKNPVDHPHGGGEGKSPIGMKRPKTPWGKPALGVKTRKQGKKSDRFILKRRKSK